MTTATTEDGGAASTTSSSPRPVGLCSIEGDEVTLDQVWAAETEVELLVDSSLTPAGAAPLRNARRIMIRSETVTDGIWHLTMVDPVGERVADYAARLPTVNPVDRSFVIEVAYTVGTDGVVALESLDAGTAINVAYAEFVFDTFGETDGELGEDPRFASAWPDLIAAGGLEMMDPSSASDRTLSMLALIHAHHGQTFILDQPEVFTGAWSEIGLAGPVEFSEIAVEASVSRNGCLVVESIASQASGESGTRSVYLDPVNGTYLGALSSLRLPTDEGDFAFSTSISVLGSTP